MVSGQSLSSQSYYSTLEFICLAAALWVWTSSSSLADT
jgi:hypothetical protein